MLQESFIFIFGLIVGSFLNAVIYRLETGESIIKGRSHCPKCGHVLRWYELVPVISFILQRGKCRACASSISWQYPLLEIATGLIFVFIFFDTPDPAQIVIDLIIASLLVVIFVYDLKHYIIPDKILYPAIGVVLLHRLIENWGALGNPLLSAILASAFFAAIFFASGGKWMGFGDVKLAFFMGLFLGWPVIIPAIFLAFVLGGIIGIALIATRKKTMKSQVPFGPFLVAGTIISMFFGAEIINWYKGFLL